MKINNRRKTILAMYGLLFLILLDLVFLIFAEQIFKIDDMVIYCSCAIIFVLVLWRLITIKFISVEVSEHIISVKYGHPFSQIRKPVLEVPLHKVISLKTKKGIMDHMLLIGINSRRGIRNFHYKIGNLSKSEAEKITNIKEFIKSYSIKDNAL